jgi:hypothetical protein
MRKVVIEIECENDAFEPHPEVEVASILRVLSDILLHRGIVEVISKSVASSDGHTVGSFRLIDWRE